MLSFSPDFDVIAFRFGIPYASPYGHRGATHSICFALLMGVLIWVFHALYSRSKRRIDNTTQAKTLRRTSWYWGLIAMLVTLSHPLLDAFTDGGLGVALWWPLSEERIFFSPQWIPVSPIGVGILSARGAYVILFETVLCLPLWLYLIWPWIRRRHQT